MLSSSPCIAVGRLPSSRTTQQALLPDSSTRQCCSIPALLATLRLQADAGPGGLRAATELLEQRGLTELPHVLSLPVHDRWGAWGRWDTGAVGCMALAFLSWVTTQPLRLRRLHCAVAI